MIPETELPPLSIKKNFLWTTFGNGIYLASQWGMLVVLAKWGNPVMVGQFSLGMALTAPIIILSQMQLRQTLVTDIKEEFHYLDNFWSRIICTFLALGCIALLTPLLGYSGEMAIIIFLISLAKAFESISDILYGRLQKFHRMDFIAYSMICKGICTLGLFCSLMIYTQNLVYSLLTLPLIWGGMLFFYDLPVSQRFKTPKDLDFSWRFGTFSRIVREALPLTLSSGLISFSGNIPRYFLEYYEGKEAVGLFSIAASPLAFISLLWAALGQAVMARAAEDFQNGRFTQFKTLALKTTGVFFITGFSITGIFWVLGEGLLSVLFSPKYSVVLPTLMVMSVGLTLNCFAVFGSLVMVGGRMFKLQFLSVFIPFLVQVFAGFFLVKKYGNFGAGLTDFTKMASSMLFTLIVGLVFYFKEMREPGKKPPAAESEQSSGCTN